MTTESANELPDIGTLWHCVLHGLMMITDITPLPHTEHYEMLYTFHVIRLKDTFHTSGIFTPTDWHTKFDRVA